MRNISGTLTMGLIIVATTGLVATYAFAADDTAGSSAPAQVQSNDNGANSATPGVNGSSAATANPSNTDSPANTPNNASNGNADDGKASQAQAPSTGAQSNDMNKSDNAATPSDTPNQPVQSQQQQPAKTHTAMSRHHIEVIQAALANSGQKVEVDGVWGRKTTEALRDFQKAHGLKATGHLDPKTRHALPLPPKAT